jgi:HSP20 family protein
MFSTLLANDVRQTLDHFRRSVDQMFENFYNAPAGGQQSAGAPERGWTFTPAVESNWDENFLTLRAILPGVKENDVRVTVQHNQLVIEGERKFPEHFNKNAYTQMNYGKFYTSWTLPSGLDLGHVECRLEDGLLEIRIPVQEASKPKAIPIHTPASKALNA